MPPQATSQQAMHQQAWAGQGAPRPPRAVPTVNPFLSTPVADYVKDAGAAVALFVAMAMPWDFAGDASEKWWAILSLLVPVLGLAVPYVMASRLLPALTPRHSLGIKLALAMPLVVSTLIAVISDLVTIGDDPGTLLDGSGMFNVDGGVGIAIALGLAGVGLMVQPRAVEEQAGLVAEKAWRTAAVATAVAGVVVGVLAAASFVIRAIVNDYDFLGAAFWVVLLVSTFLIPLVGAGIPALSLLQGNVAGRRTFAVVGWTLLVLTVFGSGDGTAFLTSDGQGGVESWSGPVGGTFLIGLAAALVLSRPSVRRTESSADPVTGWLATARLAMLVPVVLLALTAIALVVLMVDVEEFPARGITMVLLCVGAAVAGGVVVAMVHDLRQRAAATIAISVVMVIGIVIWVLAASADGTVAVDPGLTPWDGVMLFALPGLALWALWVPAPVRALFPSAAPQPWGQAPGPQQPWGAPQQQAPQQGPPQQGPPQHGPGSWGPPQGQ